MFPTKRPKYTKGINWGELYNKYKDAEFDTIKLEEEIKKTKKQYDEIEEWFKKYGEAASNLKFFQEDAKSTFLKIKLDKLKAANNDIICY